MYRASKKLGGKVVRAGWRLKRRTKKAIRMCEAAVTSGRRCQGEVVVFHEGIGYCRHHGFEVPAETGKWPERCLFHEPGMDLPKPVKWRRRPSEG